MHLKSIRLKEFRGFTDLTLADIPVSARMVMLIGPNGTGKSSIFDALLSWSGAHGAGMSWDETFHIKKSAATPSGWDKAIERVEFYEPTPTQPEDWKRLCYFRTAYRNEAEFSQGNLGAVPDVAARKFYRTIENDAAVAGNYRRLIMQTIKDVWGAGSDRRTVTLQEYADAVVKKVNDSLSRVLPHLKLESLGDPSLQVGNFYFMKGISKGYLFKNLSGGEKAIFDLLIDLIATAPFFNDSLICVDEPEAHVNPAVQGLLLRELLKLTPEESQLWIATHAIGMLRAARDIEAAAPGTVAFINFEADFDQPVVVTPTKMDRPTWQRSLQVALDDLAALVSPRQVVVCEGGVGARFVDDGLDGQVYNRIFEESQPDTQFFSTGSHKDTENARTILVTLAATVLPGLQVKRLIDRDDRSDSEVTAERAQGHLVLSRRNLELACCRFG
jgi:RecF/RecN/SMC N terminal domain